jgi:hypothetical protein
MNNSDAPTPVMPNTAIAVIRPSFGKLNAKPSRRSSSEKLPGCRTIMSAQRNVSMVNRPTFTVASFSIRP